MRKLLKFRVILPLLSLFILTKAKAGSCDSVCRSQNPSKVFYVSGLNPSTVSSYKWTLLSPGALIKGGQGTDSITLDFTNAALGDAFLTLVAYNSCDSTPATVFKFTIYDCKKPQDTTISPKDTSRIVIGPPVDTSKVKVKIFGPFHGSGTATLNTANGVITFVPSKTPFVGKDTIIKIVTTTISGVTTIDTFKILLNGNPTKVVNSDSTNMDVAKILASLPDRVFEGSQVSNRFTSSAGSSLIISPSGVPTYTPAKAFVGTDTIRIIRCDNKANCDTVLYLIKVNLIGGSNPNYISPNGDGINDVWCIDPILSIYPKTKVIIYNRWGNIVWRSSGPYGKCSSGTNVWFGQKEGSKLPVPDGVYYYLMELDDEFKTTRTGFIEIMRQ